MTRSDYSIILVEQSSTSAITDEVASHVDSVIQIPYDGPFNKALALNRGVADAAPESTVCLLDADIFPDHDFLSRNAARVAAQPDSAHLPYSDVICLLAEDSNRVREGAQPGDEPRDGYVITHPPGGCVFLDAELYRAVDGFDERFNGWGGEDRDFIDRVKALAHVHRHPELLTHLHHERPPMRDSREDIMTAANEVARGESR